MNLDAPETRLVGVPTGQLEEGRDQLEIRCLADANPPASILWRKTKSPGVTEVASIGETLMFSPIYRNHAAVYLCEASNIEGESSPVSVQVSVNCTYIAIIFNIWLYLSFSHLICIPRFLRSLVIIFMTWVLSLNGMPKFFFYNSSLYFETLYVNVIIKKKMCEVKINRNNLLSIA